MRVPKILFWLFLFGTVGSFFFVHKTQAEFVSVPDGGTYAANNTVSAIIATTSAVYIGGTFTKVGPYSGYMIPVRTSDGTASTSYSQVDLNVRAIISDRVGGWYIGGNFTQIGSTARTNLAHILADKTVDPNFAPTGFSQVNALALSSNGSKLYVGSLFALNAYNTSDGSAITAFAPTLNNGVNVLVLTSDDATLYAGGTFTTINTVSYPRLAAFNTADGIASTTFNPNVNTSSVNALALSSNGSKLYVGGAFTTVGGVTYNRLAAVTTADGLAISAFNPDMSSTVNSLALSSDDSKIYAGGAFITVGGVTYNRVAEITTADGLAVSGFNPNMNNTVSAVLLSADNTKIYVGGSYTLVGADTYGGFNRLDASTGAIDGTFTTNVVGDVLSLALTPNGSDIFVGGTFISAGGTVRNRLAALDVTGKVLLSFNPNLDNTVVALAISPDGSKLYAGGTFTTVAGVTYNRLAGLNTSNGTAISAFNPNVGTTGVNALAISSDGSKLYFGGAFTLVGGGGYNRLAAVNTADGSLITAFNPNMLGVVSALALSSDNLKIYAGGAFTQVGGVTYNRLAGVTTADGLAISAFNPNMGNTVATLTLSSDNSTLYAGGAFTTVGGVTYNHLAEITTADGVAVSAFNPNITSSASVLSTALSSDDSKIYFGGTFTAVGATSRNNLAAVTTSNGAVVSAFNPNISGSISKVVLATSTLYFDGSFTALNSTGLALRFGTISLASTTLSKTTAAVTEGTGSDSYTVVLRAPPSASVVVTPTPSANLSVSPSTLTFTTTNWSTPQTVTVTAPANAVIEGTHSGIITHAASSADESYNGITILLVTATITDSTVETPPPTSSGGGGGGGGMYGGSGGGDTSYLFNTQPTVPINTSVSSPISIPKVTQFNFTRSLTIGMNGVDVKALQQFLNAHGFTLAKSGAGSIGHETNTFGSLTRTALAKFQKANMIYPPVGYFGPITRAFIRNL